MINISSIKTHMYCPMKLYIQNHVDTNENDDYQLAIEIKKLKFTTFNFNPVAAGYLD